MIRSLPLNRNQAMSWRVWLVALLAVLLAAFMRIHGASTQSTWSDEGWNLWVGEEGHLPTTLTRLAENHHPPAYFGALSLWRQQAGDAKIMLRWLSIVAGVLSVALIYRMGADTFSPRAGLWAAALFAVFEQAVYYGQSMRHYGWLALGVCLMLCFFLRLLRHFDAHPKAAPPFGLLIGYALSVAFAMYSMYMAVCIWAVQVVVGGLLWRGAWQDKAKLFFAWVAAGLLLAPWLIYALPQQWHKVQRGIITGYHNTFTSTPDGVLMMADLLLGGQFVIGAGLCVLAVWQLMRTRQFLRYTSAWTVILSGWGVFAGLLAVNVVMGVLSERTLYFMLPSVVLLMGYGLTLVPSRGVQAIFGGLLIVWMIATPQEVVPRINSDQVAQVIAADYNAGDFVLLETGFDDVAFEYELHQTLPESTADLDASIFRSYYLYDYADDDAMMRALSAALETQTRVWLVYWNVPPRMGALLETMGFVEQGVQMTPTGANDPLYTDYPVITTALYVRPRALDARPVAPRVFDDRFVLEDVLLPAEAWRDGRLSVGLWWSVLQPVDKDYSIGVFLLDADGVTRAEHIGPSPEMPVLSWQPDAPLYFDAHTFDLPADLPAGQYQVIANIYWWQAVDAPLLVDGAPYVTLGTVTIH